MIPIRDNNPSGSIPILTYTLILINILVFIIMLTMSEAHLKEFIYTYSIIPSQIVHGKNLHTLITSMFLHGSFGHILGNMIFLHIFGDNMEDKLGRLKFLMFYLFCGLIASLAQIAINPTSDIPNLGASGAIAGVMGGYLVLFPRAKIDVLFIWGFFITTYKVSAYFMLLYWIVYQFIFGMGSLYATTSGGVAYFAHIGGFLAGWILISLSGIRRR